MKSQIIKVNVQWVSLFDTHKKENVNIQQALILLQFNHLNGGWGLEKNLDLVAPDGTDHY